MQFEQLCDHLIQACIEPCRQALKDASLSTSDIDEVILVGGSTRIPAVQAIVDLLIRRASFNSLRLKIGNSAFYLYVDDK